MLSEFYIVVEDFQKAVKKCGSDLSEWDGINRIHRARFTDLAHDMIAFSENMVRAHINATMWMLDNVDENTHNQIEQRVNHEDLLAYISGERELDPKATEAVEAHIAQGQKMVERMIRRSQSQAAQRSEQSTWDLKACYKAYFFFIRAFHDGCYGVLLNLAGATPGNYSSMNRCITRKVSPIFEQIESIPGYVEWFNEFKRKRDAIKMGQNFSLSGPANNVGVGFNEVTAEGGIVVDASPDGNKFRLSDLIEAFRYSIATVELISGSIPRSNKQMQSDAAEPRR